MEIDSGDPSRNPYAAEYVAEPGQMAPFGVVDHGRRARVERWFAALRGAAWLGTGLVMVAVAVMVVFAVIAQILVMGISGWAQVAVAATAVLSVAVGAYALIRWRRMVRALSRPEILWWQLKEAADLRGARIDVVDVLTGEGVRGSALRRLRRLWLAIGATRRRIDDVRELDRIRPFWPGALSATAWWSAAVAIDALGWVVACVVLGVARVLG